MESKIVYTQLLGKTEFTVLQETDEIDINKMKSSSAPNYVHSMDASHLIKSVNAFKRAGLGSIAVIHDSFGTHAGKTQALRDCLTKEFVKIYRSDWLTTFKEEMEEILKEEVEEEVPMIGTLDLDLIHKAHYTFA
jgi:DNA-directed RNA polymerase